MFPEMVLTYPKVNCEFPEINYELPELIFAFQEVSIGDIPETVQGVFTELCLAYPHSP